MAKSHTRAQQLTQAIHSTARGRMLASLGDHLDRLDKLAEADAGAVKAAIREILRVQGIPARRVDREIDRIFAASRAERLKVLEDAVRAAARTAHGLDKATFDAVFGDEPETPPPKAHRGADSSPSRTPLLRLAAESADDSAETD